MTGQTYSRKTIRSARAWNGVANSSPTSAIRVSCVVPRKDAERAVNVIHERLKLADVFYDDGEVDDGEVDDG